MLQRNRCECEVTLVKTQQHCLVCMFPDVEICGVPGRHVVLGFSLAQLANGAGRTFAVDIPAAHLPGPAVIRLQLLDHKRWERDEPTGGRTIILTRQRRLHHIRFPSLPVWDICILCMVTTRSRQHQLRWGGSDWVAELKGCLYRK